MGKRFNKRALSKDRVYRIKSAARAIGASEATMRNWDRDGLRIIKDKRPFLVRGADLIEFLIMREAANKKPLGDGQFYCMTCQRRRDPANGSVIYCPATASNGRLSAVCGTCGGKVGRFAKDAEAAVFSTEAMQRRSGGTKA